MVSGKKPHWPPLPGSALARPGPPAVQPPRVLPPPSGAAARAPILQPRRAGTPPPALAPFHAAPAAMQAKSRFGGPAAPGMAFGPAAKASPASSPVAQAARRGKTMSLAQFWDDNPEPPPPPAPPPVVPWGKGAPGGVAVLLGGGGGAAAAAAPAAAVAPPPAGPPTSFDGNCTPRVWTNTRMSALVGNGVRPAKFYVGAKVDDGASGDDATHYWKFNATWVKGGNYADDGTGACRLENGEYYGGTLRLHYHPHAKPTANYLHVKVTDGGDPLIGQIQNTHWLVGLLGFKKADLTPDGK